MAGINAEAEQREQLIAEAGRTGKGLCTFPSEKSRGTGWKAGTLSKV